MNKIWNKFWGGPVFVPPPLASWRHENETKTEKTEVGGQRSQV